TSGYVKSDHTSTFNTRFDINESGDEIEHKNFTNDYVRPKTSSTRTVVNIYNGSIQVLRGDLTKQIVDAIVVPSTSACLTAYVLREAGECVQTAHEIEMQNNSMQSISVNCNGVLLCEKIYFIPCSKLSYNPDKWTFRNFISEAITMATNEKLDTIRSIAFPAVGCGKYNCNSDFVAKTLIMAAAYELERQPSLKLDVYFVIQLHQYDVFHAFENVLKFLNINGSSNMNNQSYTIETYVPSKPTTRHNNKNEFTIEKRLLDYSSNEYAMVVQSFCTTMTEGLCKEMLRIELVWNNRWYKQYEIHRDEFNQRLKINTEQYLFHGCSQFAANNIIKECFNRSYAGQHGTKYGHGVYFSSQASYSHSYTEPNTRGERCMFLARVLVGNATIGTKYTKICPRGFDTTTDGSYIYVIYHDAQAFVTNNQPPLESFTIQQCTAEDEDGAIAVCLKTGDSGNDASLLFNDPKVLGYRFVAPYIHLSPDLAFVLKDSEGNVCGYVLAALDSVSFYTQYVNEWLPKMKQLYPNIPSENERLKEDWEIIYGFHNDNLQSFKLFDDYPSHLHIDLLPIAQRKGYGTKMIHRIENELQRRGSTGVHLGMAPNNTRALHFYTKLGFTILANGQDTMWLGKKLV
ncbi:unnamed protein product, partial [Adineta steineri]